MNEQSPLRPKFAQQIIEKYLSAQSNVFLVYGNTKDIYPGDSEKYLPLVDFLVEALIKPRRPSGRKIVVLYDPASGISFLDPLDRKLLEQELGFERLDKVLAASRKDIVAACASLREFSRMNVMVPTGEKPAGKVRKDFAFIIRYAEAVAPPSRNQVLLDSELLKVITLENWFTDTSFVASPDIVFLIGETLSGISERIVELPYCTAIKIDRPNEEDRKKYIEILIKEENVKTSVSADHLAYRTAGLSLLSLRQIFRQAAFNNQAITLELVFEKTKEIIEKELEGHIEFPQLDYGFNKVIGASRLIRKLEELKQCIKGDDPDLMPVGILVPGANGVGKTFIYRAFVHECGWVAVVLMNIRGPYVGQTEQNWERIRSVLEAMGNVMVMYDEADTEIGGRGERTHDVDRRLFGNILRMMSEDKNRGKIIWIIITARPDRLEPDIKRSGRAGEHLPVFDLEGPEKEAFLQHVMAQAKVDMNQFSAKQGAEFRKLTAEYYPADFDQLLSELRRRRLVEGKLTPAVVLEEIRDFIPSDAARQREYQELLAVLECTSRDVLPERYRNLSREDVERRVREIRNSTVLP